MRIGFVIATIVMVTALAGCKGADGATGPQGPSGVQGLTGPAGPGTRVVITATVNDIGIAVGYLPVALGTNTADLPVMTCYIKASDSAGAWELVTGAPGGTTPTCALYNAAGSFAATITHAPPTWTAAFVIVY